MDVERLVYIGCHWSVKVHNIILLVLLFYIVVLFQCVQHKVELNTRKCTISMQLIKCECCHQENGNTSDPAAVSVLKPAVSSFSSSSLVVGHVPCEVSVACRLFLELRGTICCSAFGPRQYSTDLRKGGLNVSHKLTLISENLHL